MDRPPRSLRIAQIAPVATATSPGSGTSVEQLVSLLTEELVRRGHDVTLFATGDSSTSARLSHTFERGYDHDDELWDWQLAEAMHVAAAYARADEFDVVHCHCSPHGLPLAQFVTTPNVHTYHVEMEATAVEAYSRLTGVHIVAVSRFQTRHFPGRPNVELIPHGIDTASFPAGEGTGGYLLYLGRLIADKGPREAVEIARSVRMPLVIAGPLEDGIGEDIAPLLQGARTTYVGQVDAVERNRLLGGAAALLYPLVYPEPFGLVAVEAMACGTPVLGLRTGAVPELVEDGLTGYVGSSVAELAELVPAAMDLDRRRILERARERFDYRRMVDRHEALYRRLARDAYRGAA